MSYTGARINSWDWNFLDGMPIKGYPFHVDPYEGSDAYSGLTPFHNATTGDGPLKTIAAAKAKCKTGRGDVVWFHPYTNTAATTSDALTSGLDWNLDNTHLIGVGNTTDMSSRCRIVNSGTVTTLVTVSGNACLIRNMLIVNETATGATRGLAVTGDRNVFDRCHIFNFSVNTAARHLLMTGADENTFRNCTIGVTTIDQTGAGWGTEFVSKCARNKFKGCDFLARATGSGSGFQFVKFVANGIQDFVEFDGCKFYNALWASYGTTLTSGLDTSVADVNGAAYFPGCHFAGVTNAHSNNQTWLWMPSRYDGTDLTTDLGLMVNPTVT